MRCQSRLAAQPERGGLLGGDDEARPEQLHAAVAQAEVSLQRARRQQVRSHGQIGMNQPGVLAQLHLHFAVLAGHFGGDGLQPPCARAGGGHGHGDAHGGAAGAVHPGVIGNGVNEV